MATNNGASPNTTPNQPAQNITLRILESPTFFRDLANLYEQHGGMRLNEQQIRILQNAVIAGVDRLRARTELNARTPGVTSNDAPPSYQAAVLPQQTVTPQTRTMHQLLAAYENLNVSQSQLIARLQSREHLIDAYDALNDSQSRLTVERQDRLLKHYEDFSAAQKRYLAILEAHQRLAYTLPRVNRRYAFVVVGIIMGLLVVYVRLQHCRASGTCRGWEF